MKPNLFKKALEARGAAFGHMIMEFGTRGIAKVLESAGLDFVVIDMEHSSFDAERVADLMAWFKATSLAPFVRVPQPLYHYLARPLDAGALGVMVPNVETPEQARQIVQAVKYAPVGGRGVGLGVAHTDYLMPDPAGYLAEANANTTIICQIESPVGVENADTIAATPGIDCLWVGHFDLSQAMEIPGDFQNPRFLEALGLVVAATRAHGKVAGAQPGTFAQATQWWNLGFRVLSWRSDIALYRIALQEGVERLKNLSA